MRQPEKRIITMGDFVVATNHLYDADLNYMGNYVSDLHWYLTNREKHNYDGEVSKVMKLSETATLEHEYTEAGIVQLKVTTPECVMIYNVDW